MIDFWLIAVYTEFDLKGNMFSARNLMLQALRNNETNAFFYVEYFRFEAAMVQRIKQRRKILMSGDKGSTGDLQFIDDEAENKNDQE